MDAATGSGRTVWLLDVDGVVNAAGFRPDTGTWPRWRTGQAVAGGLRWPIMWAPPVAEGIRRVHDSGLADVVWLTTWLEDANASLAPLLGLPRLPVLPRPDVAARSPHGFLGRRSATAARWWKLAAAQRALDPQPRRPFVWTDDDLDLQDDARTWAQQRPGPSLLLAPDTAVGLTPDHLETIEQFCADPWRGGAAPGGPATLGRS